MGELVNKKIKILVSLVGLRFNRGMGIYLSNFLENLCYEFKEQIVFVSNYKLPSDIRSVIQENNSKIISIFLPYPFVEQIIIPLIIKIYKPKVALFPANTFSLIKPRDIRYVVVIHDLIFLDKRNNHRILKHKIGKFYRAFVIKSGIYKVDKIIAVSKTTKNKLITHFPFKKSKIDVIYNPFKLNTKPPDFNVLDNLGVKPGQFLYTISGTSENKNFIFVLRAFSKLTHEFPWINLVVSGIERKKMYEDIIENLGISNKVIFTKYVSESEKIALMRACKSFIFLSKDEGFGRPIIEALYEGATVIASDIDIFREIGNKYVHYISIHDEDCLLNFFKFGIQKKYPLQEVRQYIKKNFNVDVLKEKFIETIKSLL